MSEAASADDGGVSDRPILGIWEVQSLNGKNNNPNFPNLGAAGQKYLRIGPTRYADGKSQMAGGPNARYVSNREFNDSHVNVFSERGVTQWGFVWGQFIDHNIGLRQENGTVSNIPFNATDSIEEFTNTLGYIPFTRSAAAPGTGVTNARQHINTQTAFIDAEAVYGSTDARLDWLRVGSQDGNPDNNSGALLMSSGNYLPTRAQRGNPAAAPAMAIDGRLLSHPNDATVAGDVRANESLALNATHTLFAREHNRIVNALPSWVSQQDKFQLARAIVIAEIQYITYNEFLPAIGVSLPAYQGYNQFLDPANAQEFAVVGYRAHSFIHGEAEIETEADRYSQADLDALEAQGIEFTIDGDEIEIGVPLNVGFFNPGLLRTLQLGPMLQGIGLEPQYNNDEMIDNQLRSVLFQVPVSGNPECLDGEGLPECFNGVLDLGAIDLQRARDHGIGTYNQVRNAYGLSSKTSFTSITGESTDAFPPGLGVNSPECLDIVALFDREGNPTTIENDDAVRAVKRCTLAARLKAIYGSVSNLDAFVGMLAEKKVTGSELGELQRAIWKDQFGALRDGDRFHYRNDPLLPFIRNNFGIDYRKTLAQIISANSDIPASELAANVFFTAPEAAQAAAGTASAAQTAVDTNSSTSTTEPSTATTLTRHDKNTPKSNGKAGEQTSAVAPNVLTPRSLRRRPRRRSHAHD